MGRAPDFIGLGARRAGTSWIYACLVEHPQTCAPVKEPHFFSRETQWRRGTAWYEGLFAGCPAGTLAGEFSTSYLSDAAAAARIADRYPEAKLIVSLRDPVARLLSAYRNDLATGTVPRGTSLETAMRVHPEYVDDGRYATHLASYLRRFPRERVLVLIYEDALVDPRRFIAQIYGFIGVDPTFVPSMLRRRVNVGRSVRSPRLERGLIRMSAVLRSRGLPGLWWRAKRWGVGDALRRWNTRNQIGVAQDDLRRDLRRLYADEVTRLEAIIGQELPAWRG